MTGIGKYMEGIVVVPDFIANAGAAGGLGMVLTGQVPLDPKKILAEPGKHIRGTTRQVLSQSTKEGVMPREAAIRLAEERLKKRPPFS